MTDQPGQSARRWRGWAVLASASASARPASATAWARGTVQQTAPPISKMAHRLIELSAIGDLFVHFSARAAIHQPRPLAHSLVALLIERDVQRLRLQREDGCLLPIRE